MGTKEDTEEERVNWHWRNSMRPVRFFALDARCAVFWLIWLFYIRWVSTFIVITFTMVFIFLERRGLTFDASLRAFRKWFLGQKRPGWMSLHRKRMVDYG
jgi:intracellular multiplication protein IcmT